MECKIEDAKGFLKMLELVVPAVAPLKEGRPVLSAVAVEFHADGPMVVATETHVLIAAAPAAVFAGGFPPADVPVVLVDEPARLVAWLKAECKSAHAPELVADVEDDRKVTWRMFDSVHVSRLVPAEFPRWRGLFEQHKPGDVGVFGLSNQTLPIVVKMQAKLDGLGVLRFTPGESALKPLLFEAGTDTGVAVRGLVMPRRLAD